MYSLHSNAVCQNGLHITVISMLENDEIERLLNAMPLKADGSQVFKLNGRLAHSHHFSLFMNFQAAGCLKKGCSYNDYW